MKTILTTFFALAITSIVYAQNPDKALARIRYSFTHIQDTTQKDKPYTENMLLVIGKNASIYTSYDKINRDIDMQNQIKEQMKNQAGGGQFKININRPNNKATSGVDYFYFAKENKFFTKERLFTEYLVEEKVPTIAWKITKDTASFSGVRCKKAIAHFKGRNWIAWFAPELPFQSGPWKLNGLPGLIIEAYDETKTVQFQFAGMENVVAEDAKKVAEDGIPKISTAGGSVSVGSIIGLDGASPYLGSEIKLPTDAVRTTQKELDKLKEARDKDPQGFMNAQMAASGMQFGAQRSTTVKAIPGGSTTKIVINNPIELPETK